MFQILFPKNTCFYTLCNWLQRHSYCKFLYCLVHSDNIEYQCFWNRNCAVLLLGSDFMLITHFYRLSKKQKKFFSFFFFLLFVCFCFVFLFVCFLFFSIQIEVIWPCWHFVSNTLCMFGPSFVNLGSDTNEIGLGTVQSVLLFVGIG